MKVKSKSTFSLLIVHFSRRDGRDMTRFNEPAFKSWRRKKFFRAIVFKIAQRLMRISSNASAWSIVWYRGLVFVKMAGNLRVLREQHARKQDGFCLSSLRGAGERTRGKLLLRKAIYLLYFIAFL